MPTPAKQQTVSELTDVLQRAKVVIATDYSGMSVNQMTELRRVLREQGAEYRVIKNRLALLAAERAGNELVPQLLDGITGMAFGYDDPVSVAKTIDEFVKSSRATLKVRNAVIDGRLVDSTQVAALASMPPKDILLGRLLGQLNSPVTRLVYALNGPVQGLAMVLQRRAEQVGTAS